jgi:tetratricopeptide (TPR) repeat protein
MLTGQFVNHEYGSTLIHVGRLDDAAAVFMKMRAQPDATSKARSYRSMAFLEMYRGRYDAAIKKLRQAILINQTNRFGVSEYRDRLILARALAAKGMSAAAVRSSTARRACVRRCRSAPSGCACSRSSRRGAAA